MFDNNRLSLKMLYTANASTTSLIANGSYYLYGYYLGDEIYLEYLIFVKTLREPIDKNVEPFRYI